MEVSDKTSVKIEQVVLQVSFPSHYLQYFLKGRKKKKKENSWKKNAEGLRNGLGQLGIGHDTEEAS